MQKNKKQLEFEAQHPFPDQEGKASLFKFFKLNDDHPEYLEALLTDLRLFHSLPQEFNDPFECRPQWRLPQTAPEIRDIRKRLFFVARKNGASKKGAEEFASKSMKNRDRLEAAIISSSTNNYRNVRICSYSTTKENILLWSHYANSHKGICVEFDATRPPLSISMKVNYQDEYPEIEYPLPDGARAFVPILTKSTCWAYEQEYRSILIAGAKDQPPHDETSFLLEPGTISSIYLGAQISEEHKKRLLNILEKSKTTPQVWKSKIANDSYSILFEKC